MFDDDDRDYTVVINDEEQYSIWPSGQEIPGGWREVGVTGRRSRCLEYIDGAWTDLRPKSLRDRMSGTER